MTDDQLAEQILLELVFGAAQISGCLIFHARDSRRDLGKGFPDLVIAGKRGVLFRELKSDKGELSHDQKIWRYRLMASGQDWGLWRPADWKSGLIERQLKEIK